MAGISSRAGAPARTASGRRVYAQLPIANVVGGLPPQELTPRVSAEEVCGEVGGRRRLRRPPRPRYPPGRRDGAVDASTCGGWLPSATATSTFWKRVAISSHRYGA